jgi:hypothetical protein
MSGSSRGYNCVSSSGSYYGSRSLTNTGSDCGYSDRAKSGWDYGCNYGPHYGYSGPRTRFRQLTRLRADRKRQLKPRSAVPRVV